MKVAIMESILTTGGHETDFDRILVEEIKMLGHEVVLYVPEQFPMQHDYGVKVQQLAGKGVSYAGLKGLNKAFAAGRKEFNRQRWYREMFRRAQNGEFDAIIVPTSTYRYLRALGISPLKKSPVPLIFIVHGLNPKEFPSFCKAADDLSCYPNIRIALLTLADNAFGRSFQNVYCLKPPVFTARDLNFRPVVNNQDFLRLGFFGQYRREKNLDSFLDTFLSCKFNEQVQLKVQGSTVHPDDAADFDRIIEKYRSYKQIDFLHKGLFGVDWQEAIAGVDGLIMPYASERYLYHWSAMLFTAIGYYKPFVASKIINPEILAQYNIGTAFPSETCPTLKDALEQFVNSYRQNVDIYQSEFVKANDVFSPALFAQNLIALMQ